MSSGILGTCNLCRYNRFETIADTLRDNTDDCKIYKCKSCGHIQLLPRPEINENKQFYDEDKQEKSLRPERNIENLRKNLKYDFNRRGNFLSNNFPRDVEILDVGCGYGFFLEEMNERGYKIKGIEVSKERRDLAKTIIKNPIYDIDLNKSVQGERKI